MLLLEPQSQYSPVWISISFKLFEALSLWSSLSMKRSLSNSFSNKLYPFFMELSCRSHKASIHLSVGHPWGGCPGSAAGTWCRKDSGSRFWGSPGTQSHSLAASERSTEKYKKYLERKTPIRSKRKLSESKSGFESTNVKLWWLFKRRN